MPPSVRVSLTPSSASSSRAAGAGRRGTSIAAYLRRPVGRRARPMRDRHHSVTPSARRAGDGWAGLAKTAAPPTALLNRELSWLDWNERVLELAEDDRVPLLDRVRFVRPSSSTGLDEFFMVRVAGLMDQAASGLAVRSHDGMTPAARRWRRSASASTSQVGAPVAALEARARARRWPRRESRSAAVDGLRRRRSCARSRRRFEREIFPVLTPLGVGPGQPFPYISRPVAQPRRARPQPGDRRGALRAGEGARGRAALRQPSARAADPDPARGRDRALPRRPLSRAWRCSSGRRSGSPATPTSSSRTTPTTCWRPSRPRSAGAASATSSALEVARVDVAAHARPAPQRAPRRGREGLHRSTACSTSPTPPRSPTSTAPT